MSQTRTARRWKITTAGIYCLEQISTGRRYVGSASIIERRRQQHIWDLNYGRHSNRRLQAAWKKYGAAAFRFLILEVMPNDSTSEQLCKREQEWLDRTALLFNSGGPTFNARLGQRHTQQSIDKIRIAKRLNPSRPTTDHQRKASMAGANATRGKPRPLEVRQKISAAKMGHKVSHAQKEKQRQTMTGMMCGEKSPRATISEATAIKIIADLHAGLRYKAIAQKHGTTENVVGLIKRQSSWNHLPRPWSDKS